MSAVISREDRSLVRNETMLLQKSWCCATALVERDIPSTTILVLPIRHMAQCFGDVGSRREFVKNRMPVSNVRVDLWPRKRNEFSDQSTALGAVQGPSKILLTGFSLREASRHLLLRAFF